LYGLMDRREMRGSTQIKKLIQTHPEYLPYHRIEFTDRAGAVPADYMVQAD